MSATAAVHVPGARRVEPARFGVWLFLVGEAMFFAALVAAFVVLRAGSDRFGHAGGELSSSRALFGTGLLAVASLCASRAVVAQSRARGERIVASWIRRALLFGALFTLVQGHELWTLATHGVTPRTSLYWSSFFVLISVHALHVLGALGWSAVAWRGARRGTRRLGVELSALYWHFVGVVWLVLVILLYT